MPWYSQLDLEKLDRETRLRILRFAIEKHGKHVVTEVLGVSRVTLWRYLSGKQEVPSDKLLAKGLVSREEFERLVATGERLRALGILRDDGGVDYGLALEVLALAKRDEYLKNAILRFVVQEFREDLRKMLGISLAGIKLE